MSTTRFLARAAAPLLASGAALAHPGHGSAHALEFFAGLLHLLTEPDHLAMLGVAVAAAVVAVRRVRARRQGSRR
jgi:hydrogenase/urease accessory protein HupE